MCLRRRLARASQHQAIYMQQHCGQRAVSAAIFKCAFVSAASLAFFASVCQAPLLASQAAKLCQARPKTPRLQSAPYLCQVPLLASVKLACARGYTHIEIISLTRDLLSDMTEEEGGGLGGLVMISQAASWSILYMRFYMISYVYDTM
jgi:hypothetical protein